VSVINVKHSTGIIITKINWTNKLDSHRKHNLIIHNIIIWNFLNFQYFNDIYQDNFIFEEKKCKKINKKTYCSTFCNDITLLYIAQMNIMLLWNILKIEMEKYIYGIRTSSSLEVHFIRLMIQTLLATSLHFYHISILCLLLRC